MSLQWYKCANGSYKGKCYKRKLIFTITIAPFKAFTNWCSRKYEVSIRDWNGRWMDNIGGASTVYAAKRLASSYLRGMD